MPHYYLSKSQIAARLGLVFILTILGALLVVWAFARILDAVLPN